MTAVVLSVRGEAQRFLGPDLTRLIASLSVTRPTKSEALGAGAGAGAGAGQPDQLSADLHLIGATAVDAAAPPCLRGEFGQSHPEHSYNNQTGESLIVGHTARTAEEIEVRDLGALDRLGSRLAEHESVVVRRISWLVDWDNAAWPEVRAEAISAAIAIARLRRCSGRLGPTS